MNISVRELQESDIPKIVSYFVDADENYIKALGADKKKLPSREEWIQKHHREYNKPFKEKEYYYVVWCLDNEPIGHSNINHIEYGSHAKMHLHIWQGTKRKSGLGFQLLKQTLPYYFKNFELKKIICEPYAQNNAPNVVMPKLGFELIKTYETVPGFINFKQTVNRYELTKEQFDAIYRNN